MLKTQPLEQFQRVTTAGEFRVIGFPSSLEVIPDLIPPSRITDLHIERFDPENGTAFLRWTAVGGDMDRGNGVCVCLCALCEHAMQVLTLSFLNTYTQPNG